MAANVTAQDAGETQDGIPPALTHYRGRKIAPTMGYQGAGWLVREERVREENSPKLLQALGVKPGQVVCDLGCGNGYYTLDLARLTGPQGRVLGVDIQPEMLHLLELRAAEAELKNVEPIQGTLIDPKLPAQGVDLILLVDVYHEFSHPEQMLQGIRRSLKPEGRMVLVEFRAEDLTVPIKPLHKMSRKQILKEIPPNGFRLVDEYEELPWQHVMFFQRDDSPKEPQDKD
jgi:ubiquinone/menaquinone biosynthesis C-methylase UbiE